MTPANVKQVEKLAEHFRTLAEENPDASVTMYSMLEALRIMQFVMTDLHFRPEANK